MSTTASFLSDQPFCCHEVLSFPSTKSDADPLPVLFTVIFTFSSLATLTSSSLASTFNGTLKSVPDKRQKESSKLTIFFTVFLIHFPPFPVSDNYLLQPFHNNIPPLQIQFFPALILVFFFLIVYN